MQYFNFYKLEAYQDMLDAILISGLFFFVIYVMTSLYYWITRDLLSK